MVSLSTCFCDFNIPATFIDTFRSQPFQSFAWPLCWDHCDGWDDDGTTCFEPCRTDSTATVKCTNYLCAEDSWTCFGAIANIVVSVALMLSNLIPTKALMSIGIILAKQGMKAAMAVMKKVAKSIAKKLIRKAKRKV
jgi:hypothetical protein